jgi:hypothetical protein
MLASFVNVISLSGSRVPIHHADGQIPMLMHTPQHTPLEHLSNTFMLTLLRCAG